MSNRTKFYVGPKRDISRSELSKLEVTGKYVCEEKHDGVWGLMEIQNGKVRHIESRVGIEFMGADVEGLIGLQVFPDSINNTLIVGELVADWVGNEQNGTRRFRIFDIILLNNNGLRDEPLCKRREILETLWSQRAPSTGDRIFLVEQRTNGFQLFFDEIIAKEHGEGVVVKKKFSYYHAKNSDGKIEEWVRCKPRRTVDYVVTGHGVADKGTPNLQLSLYKNSKLVYVMKCGIPKELGYIPPPNWVGKVVELIGQEIFPSGSLRFGEIKRIRTDKNPIDCTIESAYNAIKVA